MTAAHPNVSRSDGTLSKSVFALAIEPLTIAFTTTGRKAYDVMLWIAQRHPATPDGGYSSPVSDILRGYGSNTKASERVQRYIEQMVQTTVLWRPLAASDSGTLHSEGCEPGAWPAVKDEARTFPLLAEARLYIRGGEAWVTCTTRHPSKNSFSAPNAGLRSNLSQLPGCRPTPGWPCTKFALATRTARVA